MLRIVLLVAGSLTLFPFPIRADVTGCRNALFVDHDLVGADNLCAAAVGADPADGEARLFRAITRLLRLTLEPSLQGLLDGVGLSAAGRNIFDFRAELPTNTTGEGIRRGATIDFWPFTVTANGAVSIDVLSWEQSPQSQEPVDVNGDGEIAFFDSMLFLFRDDGSLDAADLLAENDESFLEGQGDGSVSFSDSFLSRDLAPGTYLLAIAPYPTDLDEVVEGFSSADDTPLTLGEDEFGFFVSPSDHGDYRITWTGSTNRTVESGNLRWLFVHLADDSPRGGEVQSAVEGLLHPAIGASLQDLDQIGQAFATALTPDELAALGITSLAPIEVDLGDVQLLEAWLRAVDAALWISEAYGLDFDVDEVFNTLRTGLRIQEDVIDANPGLFALRPGAAAALGSAKTATRASIDAYLAASRFIRSETDLQDDDLTTIEPGDPSETGFRQDLLLVRSSLDAPVSILAGSDAGAVARRDRLNQALGTDFGPAGAGLHLGPAFDSPVSLRSLLPPVAYDPLQEPENYVEDGTFPDPTFHGVLVPEPPADLARWVALVAVGGSIGYRRQRRVVGAA